MPCDFSGSFIDAPSDEDDFHCSKECKTQALISNNPTQSDPFESQRRVSVSFVTGKLPEPRSRSRTDSSRSKGYENRQEAVAKNTSPVETNRLIGISAPNRYMVLSSRGTDSAMHSHHDTALTLHTSTTSNDKNKSRPACQYHDGNREPDRVGSIATPRRINFIGDSFERKNQERGNGDSTETSRHTLIPRPMLAATMKLKAAMFIGVYFLMVTFTTDLVIFSNMTRPWSSQISIQRSAAYGVSHGREIAFSLEANENLGNLNAGTLDVAAQRSTGNYDTTTNNRQQENSSKSLNGYGDDNHSERSLVSREGKNLRRPQLAFARTTKIQKSAPIFRPPEPRLKDMQGPEPGVSKDTVPIEKFVLKDLGPMGSLHEDTASDEISFGTIVGALIGLGSALCLSLMLFIGGLRETKRRWDVFQAQRLWLQSQRSR